MEKIKEYNLLRLITDAKECNNAEIKRFYQSRILESGSLQLALKFAKEVPDADIDILQQKIIESGSPIWNYQFVKDVKNADIKKAEEVILKSCHPEINFLFAKNIKGADIKAHEQTIIKSGDAKHCRMFAQEFIEADFKGLQQAVIESGDVKECFEFAKLPKADILALGQVVIDSRDIYYNYIFAETIYGADVDDHKKILEDALKTQYFKENRIKIIKQQIAELDEKATQLDALVKRRNEKALKSNLNKPPVL